MIMMGLIITYPQNLLTFENLFKYLRLPFCMGGPKSTLFCITSDFLFE